MNSACSRVTRKRPSVSPAMIVPADVGVENMRLETPSCLAWMSAVDDVSAVMNTNSTRLLTAPNPNWPTALSAGTPFGGDGDHRKVRADGDRLLGCRADAHPGDVGGESACPDGGGVLGDGGIDERLHFERIGVWSRDERQASPPRRQQALRRSPQER